MIYFDRPLQNRVHQLFHDSLERFGILALGHKESIRFTGFEDSYEELDAYEKLYRRDPMSHDLVAIGASWGGLDAVRTVLGGLPAELDAAVVIAQHRAPESHPTAFRDLLGAVTRLKVREAGDKDELRPGAAYIAAPDYHLLVEHGTLALTIDEPVQLRAALDRRAASDGRRGVP